MVCIRRYCKVRQYRLNSVSILSGNYITTYHNFFSFFCASIDWIKTEQYDITDKRNHRLPAPDPQECIVQTKPLYLALVHRCLTNTSICIPEWPWDRADDSLHIYMTCACPAVVPRYACTPPPLPSDGGGGVPRWTTAAGGHTEWIISGQSGTERADWVVGALSSCTHSIPTFV